MTLNMSCLAEVTTILLHFGNMIQVNSRLLPAFWGWYSTSVKFWLLMCSRITWPCLLTVSVNVCPPILSLRTLSPPPQYTSHVVRSLPKTQPLLISFGRLFKDILSSGSRSSAQGHFRFHPGMESTRGYRVLVRV